METEEVVVKLRYDVKVHEKRISYVEQRINMLHKDLGDLKAVLVNIKWWLVGIGTFYMVQEVGVVGFIKKIVGL